MSPIGQSPSQGSPARPPQGPPPDAAPAPATPSAEPAAAGRSLRTISYHHPSFSTDPADASGDVALVALTVPKGLQAQVERMNVTTTENDSDTVCRVYVGSTSAVDQVDFTGNGNDDVADEAQPILVPSSQSLIIRWTGIDEGGRGHAKVQYRLVELVQ